MNVLQVFARVSWACGTPFVLLLDRQYEPQRTDELQAAVRTFQRVPYVPERFDCDDFAFAFRAHAGHGVGIAISPRHCWNIALCTDGVRHIEPQTGELRARRWALLAIV